MSNAPVICFGQQPCGFFPKRFLVAKIQAARRLQKEIGGEIVFFYHDSDHDPRETQTILSHRKTNESAILNFAFVNKIQRKFSPLYLKRIVPDWKRKTELQLPNYLSLPLIELFKRVSASDPLAPTGGEGRGEGATVDSRDSHSSKLPASPSPQPSPPRGAREKKSAASVESIADFCLAMYGEMKLLEGIRVMRSSDPQFRRAACDISEFFVDVPYEGEIVRARFASGTPVSDPAKIHEPAGVPLLTLHEGGNSFITLPMTPFTKEQISPARDTRLRWMQSVIRCTHYIAGAGEKDYLRPEDAPEITFIQRDAIDRSDEAWTEIS